MVSVVSMLETSLLSSQLSFTGWSNPKVHLIGVYIPYNKLRESLWYQTISAILNLSSSYFLSGRIVLVLSKTLSSMSSADSLTIVARNFVYVVSSSICAPWKSFACLFLIWYWVSMIDCITVLIFALRCNCYCVNVTNTELVTNIVNLSAVW